MRPGTAVPRRLRGAYAVVIMISSLVIAACDDDPEAPIGDEPITRKSIYDGVWLGEFSFKYEVRDQFSEQLISSGTHTVRVKLWFETVAVAVAGTSVLRITKANISDPLLACGPADCTVNGTLTLPEPPQALNQANVGIVLPLPNGSLLSVRGDPGAVLMSPHGISLSNSAAVSLGNPSGDVDPNSWNVVLGNGQNYVTQAIKQPANSARRIIESRWHLSKSTGI